MILVKDSPLTQLIEELDDRSHSLIYCRSCLAPITSPQYLTIIGASDEYRFTNPAGVGYHIRCFHHAPGCSLIGSPTEEASWFASYQWQLAYCTECGDHLGWYYEYTRSLHNPRFFFGLITGRLIHHAI